MEFSYSQTENFEMEKLSSDTGYFKKKTVEINRGIGILSYSSNMKFQFCAVLGGWGFREKKNPLKYANLRPVFIGKKHTQGFSYCL